MDQRESSQADLHVHSKYSDRPSEWFLRRIGAPECFVEPVEVYRRARQRGMDFVTISDHNCIRGALEIAHLPGTFISNEITAYFPEDGCKVHILVWGIDERSMQRIQELRANIYELRRYLVEEDILTSVAHPLWRINGRLSIDHLEKLLVMFNRFEAINGARDRKATALVNAIFGNLTPDLLARMADRHGIEPSGPYPWKKTFSGGSDDHSGVHIGHAHTVTPKAATVAEFLEHLRRGDHEPAGNCGGSVMMAQSLYHIAYSYYRSRFLQGEGDKPTLLGELFRRLLENRPKQKTGITRWMLGRLSGLFWPSHLARLSEVERTLIRDFAELFSADKHPRGEAPLLTDHHTFQISCQISHVLGYTFLRRFLEFARQGRLIESLQTVASLAPVALSMAPYLAAFKTQHKDDGFFRAVATHFQGETPVPETTRRRAWITDTYGEVNGVSRTIEALAVTAQRTGYPLTVFTCQEQLPDLPADVANFAPVGTFRVPEYESQLLCFPPFLEVIEAIERRGISDLIISTPGPMGLAGLAAARLLGLPTVGIYHTDFVQYVRYLTQDDMVADMSWKFLLWFYEQMDVILAPTEYYRRYLIDRGIDPRKVAVMSRGVDTQLFQPGRRHPAYYERHGLNGAFKFLYVGRISKEKGLDRLADAFDHLLARGHQASLAIVGEGPWRGELEKRFRHRPVVFTGPLRGEELATAYASADALVFPSTTDTFGNVVLEAQAAGVPVIVTDRGGPAEIVRTYDSGVIVDGSRWEPLAEAMEQLYLAPQRRSELSQRGLQNVAEHTWQRVLEDLWAIDPAQPPHVNAAAYRAANIPEGSDMALYEPT